jgi:protein-S-isoprenylcysteine O-methyltransferase Ste14
MAKEQADDLPTRLGVLLALGSSAAFDFKTVSAKRSPMRIVRLATGILALALAAYVLFIGGVLAFGPDAGDASAPNGLARLIGFVLLLLAAAFGWVGWRLVRKRRPIARGEVPDVSNLP